MQTTYKIIAKDNGKFGLQRIGGIGVYGNFDTEAEASEAAETAYRADGARQE